MRNFCCLIVSVVCFTPTGFAFNLQCSETSYWNWPVIGSVYYCWVKDLSITRQGEVMDLPNAVADNLQIKGLWMGSLTINYVPIFEVQLANRMETLEIQLSHLKSVDRNDLRQFPNLRYLGLSSNDIEKLDADLFESTPNLEYVDFSTNNIKSVELNLLESLKKLQTAYFYGVACTSISSSTSLDIVKAQLLFSCGGMQEIERRMNELKKEVKKANLLLESATKLLVPLLETPSGQIIANSTDQQTVDVICDQYSDDVKACEVVDLMIENPNTKIGYVKTRNGRDVQPTSFSINRQAVLFMPTNLHDVFSNLEQLEVIGCGIFVIDNETFQGLALLKFLNLTGNKLLSIQAETFAVLKALVTLDLSHNNIAVVESGAEKGPDDLKVLQLNSNKLEEISFDFKSSPIKSVRSLDLTNNVCVNLQFPQKSLEEIEAKIASNCTTPIDFVCESSEFRVKCEARNLRVERPKSRFRTVEGLNVGQSTKDFTKFEAKDQLVQFLPRQIALTFPNLQKITILGSQLSILTKNDFVGLNKLKWIEICDNKLISIDAETFLGLNRLEHLDLSSNSIQSLPAKVFEHLTQLNELRLSINNIKILKLNVFSRNPKINTFSIDNNDLQQIDPKIVLALQNSDVIDFSKNACIDRKFEKTDDDYVKDLRELTGSIEFDCT